MEARHDLGSSRCTLGAHSSGLARVLAQEGYRPSHGRLAPGPLNGIIFRMRSGCQCDQLPRRFRPKSTVHDWFQRWGAGGVFDKIMAVLIVECDELRGVEWKWQAANGSMGKAHFGGIVSAQIPQIVGKMAANIV